MAQLNVNGRRVCLSYSTNVHPAETVDELSASLRDHVAPVSRRAFASETACVNLRVGMKQADALLDHPPLPSTSSLSDAILKAPPSAACEKFLATLSELKLNVVSINAFPIRDFHAPRVKEQVYSPPWTDGGRALYSLKIAKVMTHFMEHSGRSAMPAAISVPSGVFNGLYPDSEEVRSQCAHFLTECARELLRLERLTGKTVVLGLEPEPMTTCEAISEFIKYYDTILADARQKFPSQLGISRAQAEELARRFITINLDLCHQAVEFEDAVEDLKLLKAAGITCSGLHLSAALTLKEPSKNEADFARLKALDEPRYLHQIVARKRDGTLARFSDLPDLWNPRRMKNLTLSDFSELRCHFHVPLFTDLGTGALGTTRDSVGPAVRHALAENLTDNFIVETYTWNVLAGLAAGGNAGARTVVGGSGAIDIHAGIVKELEWAKAQMTGA
ncbi:MAG TPA: metabolite traffic protein EboE [Planctomycetota bacterium]|nr:metabolite traffic protein EboE [Planctomycetota bacterium]